MNCIELVSVCCEIVRKFWRFGLVQSFVYETGRFEEFSRLFGSSNSVFVVDAYVELNFLTSFFTKNNEHSETWKLEEFLCQF